jgi:hypothetical protein
MGKLFGHTLRVQDEAGRLRVHLDGKQIYSADLTPSAAKDMIEVANEIIPEMLLK